MGSDEVVPQSVKDENAESANPPPIKNYDDEVKRIICLTLETEVTDRTDRIEYKIGNERIAAAKQKRVLAWAVAAVSACIPLVMLFILVWQMLNQDSVLANMDAVPQAVFISATFISFIVVYAVLIKSMFQVPAEKESPLAMKESLEILNTLRDQSHG